jgi:hypothetical protein
MHIITDEHLYDRVMCDSATAIGFSPDMERAAAQAAGIGSSGCGPAGASRAAVHLSDHRFIIWLIQGHVDNVARFDT